MVESAPSRSAAGRGCRIPGGAAPDDPCQVHQSWPLPSVARRGSQSGEEQM
ncbi:EspF repeat-containing protein [Streptomyces sp. NPDC023998]|uniref:EspF repeat-containing protein n=1 Tax=Streptomyces sp. NPDC023998 TaxID=3154597 RepID=UPI0033EC69A5